MYDEGQAGLVLESLPGVIQLAEAAAAASVRPLPHVKRAAADIVMATLRDRGRKVCGGVSMDEHIRLRGQAGIYPRDGAFVADIDAYSPDPVSDVIEICNRLYRAGIPCEAREAQHIETYTVIADTWRCCDISYVHRAAFNRIPCTTLPDGVAYVAPAYMVIDYLRILNDPLGSYWRWDRAVPRFLKLLAAYPLERPRRTVDVPAAARQWLGDPPGRDAVLAFLAGRQSVVVTGVAAYLFLASCRASVAAPDRDARSVADACEGVPLEVVSVDAFEQDARDLYGVLAARHADLTYHEYHPFCDYVGRRGHFLAGKRLVARVFESRYKAVPFMSARLSASGGPEATTQVATFAGIALHAMAMRFRARVESQFEDRAHFEAKTQLGNMYDALVGDMYRMRQEYLAAAGKTLFDDTPFKEFVIPTAGEALSNHRVHQLLYDARLRKYNLRGFKYAPSPMHLMGECKYTFMNTSGNEIQRREDCLFTPPPPRARSPAQ
jgi:hypothetical protein